MGYTGKKPTNVVDVSETQSLTVDGDLTVDTSTLKVDSTNNRVGVGTASPAFALDVQSTGDPAQIRLKEDGNTNGVKIVNFDGDEAQINNVDNGPLVIKTNDTERMRISNAGDVAIGTSSPNTYTNYTTVTINGAGASGSDLDFEKGGTVIGSIFSRSSDAQFTVSSYSGDLAFRAGGSERVNIQASDGMLTALPVYSLTTSGSANVNVQSSGALLRSTSSEKYKQNIEDMELSYAQAILNLRPVYYKSKCKLDNADDSHWGFIAEEVEKIDPRLVLYKTLNVTYNDEGTPVEEVLETPEPEGVQYDRLTPAIVKLLQEQQKLLKLLRLELKHLRLDNGKQSKTTSTIRKRT